MFFRKSKLSRMNNRKLVKHLMLLQDEMPRNAQAIAEANREIAKRDRNEIQSEKVDFIVSRFKRHTVMETKDILYKELHRCIEVLDNSLRPLDGFDRLVMVAKKRVVLEEINRRDR